MRAFLTGFLLLSGHCLAASPEPVVGGRCEGCELVFVGQPDTIGSSGRIAAETEPGEPLLISGQVRDGAGQPVAGIIVYAYQTDASGIYPKSTTRHGRLRGWARSDADGRYRFHTIRPAAYPGRQVPQHVHLHVIEPGKATYYIDDLTFTDDPLLTAGHRRDPEGRRGGSGIADPRRTDAGGWEARRDIVLGANIPGYRN